MVTLDNGIVRAVVEESTSYIISLKKAGGPELIGDKVYLSCNTELGFAILPHGHTMSYQMITNTPDLVEISFKQTSSSKLPFDVELRYVLQDGQRLARG